MSFGVESNSQPANELYCITNKEIASYNAYDDLSFLQIMQNPTAVSRLEDFYLPCLLFLISKRLKLWGE